MVYGSLKYTTNFRSRIYINVKLIQSYIYNTTSCFINSENVVSKPEKKLCL